MKDRTRLSAIVEFVAVRGSFILLLGFFAAFLTMAWFRLMEING